jgi:hypothetical protein
MVFIEREIRTIINTSVTLAITRKTKTSKFIHSIAAQSRRIVKQRVRKNAAVHPIVSRAFKRTFRSVTVMILIRSGPQTIIVPITVRRLHFCVN